MGHIKELEGVDFIIESRPQSVTEESAISEYIRAFKAKNAQKKVVTKRVGRASAK